MRFSLLLAARVTAPPGIFPERTFNGGETSVVRIQGRDHTRILSSTDYLFGVHQFNINPSTGVVTAAYVNPPGTGTTGETESEVYGHFVPCR